MLSRLVQTRPHFRHRLYYFTQTNIISLLITKMERKGNDSRLLRVGLAVFLSGCMSKSQPIVGRDMVSPVVRVYGENIVRESLKEVEGLTPEEIKARDECLSGFSCATWELLNQGK